MRHIKTSTMQPHQRILVALLFTTWAATATLGQVGNTAFGYDSPSTMSPKRSERDIVGWRLFIANDLMEKSPEETEAALALLKAQLEEILRVVPAEAVQELKKVPLYFSRPYEGTSPKAEYHPGRQWLINNGRDPVMTKGVEFTNIEIFERETRRMPNFALHELAHAYHDRVLPKGHNNDEVRRLYEKAKDAGLYNNVARKDADGNVTHGLAYAISNPAEYFAETTEAYFSTNDFFPFIRQELKRHDPEMDELLGRLWGVK